MSFRGARRSARVAANAKAQANISDESDEVLVNKNTTRKYQVMFYLLPIQMSYAHIFKSKFEIQTLIISKKKQDANVLRALMIMLSKWS